MDEPEPQRAAVWLASVQQSCWPSALGSQPSAGWGGDAGIEPSIEETALAAEVLLDY